jgi:hypothetical protein
LVLALLSGFALLELVEIAPADAKVKAAVLELLDDPKPDIRQSALQAIIDVRPLTSEDLEKVKGMEKDSDSSVARWSEIALRNIRLNAKKKRKK